MKFNIYCILFLLITISCKSPNLNDARPIGDPQVNAKATSAENQSNLAHPTAPYFKTNKFNFPWLKKVEVKNLLANRIACPKGYKRVASDNQTEYLRSLPLKPGHPKVKLFNGQLKKNQSAQFAVLDLDVGKKDLQQCADAAMRLRAEYLLQAKLEDAIHFKFTNGDNCKWSLWKDGWRPHIKGNNVDWKKSAKSDDSYKNFKKYLEMVYTYAGSLSLSKEMKNVSINNMQAGDVLIQGGSPGHAVMILDMAENAAGKKVYLLAQSYMPAQEMHLLKNPNNKAISPWYELNDKDVINTPEWTFYANDLKRF